MGWEGGSGLCYKHHHSVSHSVHTYIHSVHTYIMFHPAALLSSFKNLHKFSPLIMSSPHRYLVHSISDRPARPPWRSLQEHLYGKKPRSSHATKNKSIPLVKSNLFPVSAFPARAAAPGACHTRCTAGR